MNFRFFLVLASALSTAACFSAVPEQLCLGDAGCPLDGGAGGGTGGSGGGTAGGTGGSGGGAAGTGGGTAGGVGGAGGGTAGGTGGTGGSGGGSSDAGVCGCKTALGTCQAGDGPLACGSGGAACVTCNVGQQCVAGACVTAACSATTCAGCCTNNFCVTGNTQNAFACGSGGAACIGCTMGQSCINGACVATPPCGPTTCPTGCCAQNQCLTIQSRFACGQAGAMCVQCPMGNVCTAGVCTPGTPFDAGLPPGGDGGTVAVGSPCTTVQSCRPPQNAICIQETQFGQPTGYPGGYCTAQCGPATACVGGECVTELVFGTSQSSCRASCPAPGTGQSTCRAGYVCVGTTPPGYCRPACGNGGLAGCSAGQQCGDAGYCN